MRQELSFSDIQLSDLDLEELVDTADENYIEELDYKKIAIIGIDCVLPSASDKSDFWNFMFEGKNVCGELPESRRKDIDEYQNFINKKHSEHQYYKAAFLEEIDKFDYTYFHITPNEAKLLDPKQRLFIQSVERCFQDAGYNSEKLRGKRIGVYAGDSDFGEENYFDIIQNVDESQVAMSISGNFRALMPSRISYYYDFRGPSMLVDTACSSSLVALHLACQALQKKECDAAVVGSVSVHLIPKAAKAQLGIESADGLTRAFDNGASGTGIGEGIVSLLIKPLEKAVEAGNHIYGVIDGSAINQDGNSIGITAPNMEAQADVIERAWQDAGVNPEEISYIEAHGTGTKLGDPIEVDGLKKAFSKYTEKKQFCALGSVKNNIGHLYAASGLVSVVKCLEAMEHGIIPGNIYFDKPNAAISFIDSPLYVNDLNREWKPINGKRLCGISSFGLSGTNCHMVLEAYSEPYSLNIANNPGDYILPISAMTKEALVNLVNSFKNFVNDIDSSMLGNLCYTAAVGRRHMPYRVCINFTDIDDLKTKLVIASKVLNNEEIDATGVFVSSNIGEGKTKNKGLFDESQEICRRYVENEDVSWDNIFSGELRRRISIPVYDFDKKRCWISIPEFEEVNSSDSMAVKNTKIDNQLKYPALIGRADGDYSNTERLISAILNKVMGFEELDIMSNFSNYGSDSLVLTKVYQEINKYFECDISIADIFSYPSVYLLSKYIDEKYAHDVIKVQTQKEQLYDGREVAIIGMAGRFSGADDLDQFWEKLSNGECMVRGIPDERREDIVPFISEIDSPEFIRAGYLNDIASFDSAFFHISPKEAVFMDPSQRLLLEQTEIAIEEAGYGGERLKGSNTGVYIGYTSDVVNSYGSFIYKDDKTKTELMLPGNLSSVLAGRISYYYDLKGPSIVVDSACSSSMIALINAVKDIRHGECDMALVGSAKVDILPLFDPESNLGIESPEFKIRAFDNNADGTTLGEGVGVIVVKNLQKALEDHDNILAVIRGGAVNQDGTTLGLMAPSAASQTQVLIDAWEDGGIDPEKLSYIETHGTGTKLGDPVEFASIKNAIEKYTKKKQFCAIGSVKSNIGHLYQASGLASIMKVILQMQHDKMLPSINFNMPNEMINFDDSPVYFNDILKDWNNQNKLCGVSSFGLSGTNSHVVLENYCVEKAKEKKRNNIFVLSAQSEQNLEIQIKKYADYIANDETLRLTDICYTQLVGRAHYPNRIAIIADSKEQLITKLSSVELLVEQRKNGIFSSLANYESYDAFDTDIERLAYSYIEGNMIQYSDVLDYSDSYIVKLPTYNFNRSKYWYGKEVASSCELILQGRKDDNYSEQEMIVAKAFSDCLGISKLNVTNSLFELGGDSITAMKVVDYICSNSNYKVNVNDVLRHLTIEKVAAFMKENDNVSDLLSELKDCGEREYYPLSSAQKRIYILQEMNPDSVFNNIPLVYRINGEFNKERFERSVQEIIKRHDSLRTNFSIYKGKPVQIISDDYSCNIEYIDASSKDVDQILLGLIKPFNLHNDRLVRVAVLNISDVEHLLFVDMHHIISDGISVNIFTDELVSLYQGKTLEKVKLQFNDYACWEEKLYQSDGFQKNEEYWKKVLLKSDVLNMQTDFSRPPVRTYEGKHIRFSLNPEITNKFNELAKELDATVNTILLAIYSVLLSKYTDQDIITVGTLVAGRNYSLLENMIGVFNNFLPIITEIDLNRTFKEYLEDMRQVVFEAYDNSDYPYDMMVEKLISNNDRTRNPIFDTMLIFQNQIEPDSEENKEGSWDVEPYFLEMDTSELDFKIDVIKGKNGELNCVLEYNTDLYMTSTMSRFADHFANLCEGLVNAPEKKMKEVSILSNDEFNHIAYELNNTEVEYDNIALIHQLFERQAESIPDKVAVRFRDEYLTYKELNEKANILAHILIEKGIRKDEILGILMDKSLEMYVSILAILKAGCAYLPISTEFPEERIKYMLEDSKARYVLVIEERNDSISDAVEQLIISVEKLQEGNMNNPKVNINSYSLAYIIYTSGSTGKPKGVMIEHHSVINRLAWMHKKYGINENDIIMQKTKYTFDVSVWELFLWFFVGGSVVLLPSGDEKAPELIVKAIKEYGVSVMHFVPSMLSIFLEYLKSRGTDGLDTLRLVFASGEALNLYQVNLFNKLLYERFNTELHNLYGPTEATVDVSYYPCMPQYINQSVPIGKPIDNVQLYVISKYGELKPIGTVGELHISGVCLARGYLNREKLTCDKFVSHILESERKMYKTGDLVKMLPDGNIDYLGRIDNQVKIRGFRIELGEIEKIMLQHELIKEVLVIDVVDVDGNKQLCAYYVADEELPISEMRDFLRVEMPDYMVPSYFVRLDSIPLSPNGKADRKRLPEPTEYINTNTVYVEPEGEVEIRLCKIFSEILHVAKVGALDDFFELGGNSLKASAVVSKIYDEYKIELPLMIVFNHPNVRDLAKTMEEFGNQDKVVIPRVQEMPSYLVSPAQKRVYLSSMIGNADSTMYNLTQAFILQGELDVNKMQIAMEKLIQKHETLRTTYEMHDDEIVQIIHDEAEVYIEKHDIEECNIESTIKEFIKPFDLCKLPIVRMLIGRIEASKHLIVLDINHIAIDGLSYHIIFEDILRAYNGQDIGKCMVRYRDYTAWYNDNIANGVFDKMSDYWAKVFEKKLCSKALPRDVKDSPENINAGAVVDKKLNNELYRLVQELKHRYNTTTYVLLLGLYNLLLSRYTNNNDIVVGTPVSGRQNHLLDSTVGMFVNTLAIRTELQNDESLAANIQLIKNKVISAIENQNYPYEMLLRDIQLKNSNVKDSLFDYFFVFQNTDNKQYEFADMTIEEINLKEVDAKFELTFIVEEGADDIQFMIEYRKALYSKEFINKMLSDYIALIEDIYNDDTALVKDIFSQNAMQNVIEIEDIDDDFDFE